MTQLTSLGVPVTDRCLERLENLTEAAIAANPSEADAAVHRALEARGVETHWHGSGGSGGFWAESVAELDSLLAGADRETDSLGSSASGRLQPTSRGRDTLQTGGQNAEDGE